MSQVIEWNGHKVDVDRALMEITREECEQSLYAFLMHAWRFIDPAPFKPGWVIDALAEHLEAVADGDIKRLCINVPPRCSKSSIISVAFPAWVWAQSHKGPISGPGASFLCASYAHSLALRDSVKCRRLIKSNWYQKMWGDRFQITPDQDMKIRFQNNKGGERLITSVDAGVTGEGANCPKRGTRISTPTGLRNIEDIRPLDEVFGFDHLQGKVIIRKVVAAASRLAKDIYELHTVQGRTLECTGEHPVFAEGRGYIPLAALGRGDRLFVCDADGRTSPPGATLDSVKAVTHAGHGTHRVYDLQVEGCHNFFAEGILIHNCILIDDANNAKEVLSEAVIQSTNEDWWDGAMSTRLNDPKTGAYINVQQRLGESDLTGHILSKDTLGEWTHLMLPMRYEPERSMVSVIGWTDPRTEPGELLWPARFGEEEVRRLEGALGSWRASGQLQQRPEPKGGGIIKRDWWRTWPPEGEKFDAKGQPLKPLQNPACSFIVASLDTAYTEKTMNDPSALTIWGVFAGDPVAQEVRASDEHSVRVYTETSTRVILLHAWTKHLEIHPLVNEVAKSCKLFNVDKLLIEDKAAGHSVAQELRRLFSNEPWAVQLINPRNLDKMARLYSVQHLWEEGMIYAPDRTWAETVIIECSGFPNASRDDLVDTTSQALRHLRDIGLLQRGVEITADVTESVRHIGRPPGRLYPS